MPYNITRTNGTYLVTVADEVTDNSTSLTLIGKNYSGYGQVVNQNYIKLLENFSNSTTPPNPIQGQLWWNSGYLQLKVYNGTSWRNVSGSTSSATTPLSPITGDFWWDTANGQLKIWNGSAWVVIGPGYTAIQGTTGVFASTITDTPGGFQHTVDEIWANNVLVAVISKDDAFQVNTLTGFTWIYPGFNLSSVGSYPSLNPILYNGTATNATLLNNSSSYLRSDIGGAVSGNVQITSNDGLSILGTKSLNIGSNVSAINLSSLTSGANLNLSANVGGVNTVMLTLDGTNGNITVPNIAAGFPGGSISNKYYVDSLVSGAADAALDGTHAVTGNILPGTTNLYNFGSSGAKFSNIYSTTFTGNLVGTSDLVTVSDAASDTTTWVMLATNQTGSQSPRTSVGITYNASTGALTASTFVGSLSGGSVTSTTINASGVITATDVTDASSSTTGALIVAGGVGIAKKLYVGSSTDATGTTSGALVVTGGVGIARKLYVGSTAVSTSTSTGALVVTGGAGIGGALYADSGTFLLTVRGNTSTGTFANSALAGAASTSGTGVWGSSSTGNGVYGSSPSGIGVYGISTTIHGVWGISTSAHGVVGSSTSGRGVYGSSNTGIGVLGWSLASYGVVAESDTTSPINAAFRIVPQDTQPTGPNAVGDIYVTTAGVLKICTAAGTPGTWISVGAQPA